MSVRDQMVAAIEQVAAEHDRPLAPVTDELVLLESGLDSLGFAVLIARLERDLDVDPFSSPDFGEFPTTFGDLVRLYEAALSGRAAS